MFEKLADAGRVPAKSSRMFFVVVKEGDSAVNRFRNEHVIRKG